MAAVEYRDTQDPDYLSPGANPHQEGTPEWYGWEDENGSDYYLEDGMEGVTGRTLERRYDAPAPVIQTGPAPAGTQIAPVPMADAPTWNDGWTTYTVDPETADISYWDPKNKIDVTVTPSGDSYKYLMDKMVEAGAFNPPRETPATTAAGTTRPGADTSRPELNTTGARETAEADLDTTYQDQLREAQNKELLHNAMFSVAGQGVQTIPKLLQPLWDPLMKENNRRLAELEQKRIDGTMGLSSDQLLLAQRTLVDPTRALAGEGRVRRESMQATGPVRDAASLHRSGLQEQQELGAALHRSGATIAGAQIQAVQSDLDETERRLGGQSEYRKSLASKFENVVASVAPLLGMTAAAQPLELDVWARLAADGYSKDEIAGWRAALTTGTPEEQQAARSFLTAFYSDQRTV